MEVLTEKGVMAGEEELNLKFHRTAEAVEGGFQEKSLKEKDRKMRCIF